MIYKIKAVSLFDGISCGRAALDELGFELSSYQAFEIDKYAKAISRYNYPDIMQNGDVLGADFSKFTGYDLVMGGSPCTFWSIAKTNREMDKDGLGWKLFMRFVEAVRIIKPRVFLYENVASMPASIKAYISEELGAEPILINSALVSAQQRKRLYWTNIKSIEQPRDRGILLKDILETELPIALSDKSQTILSTLYKENALSMLKRSKTGLFVAEKTNLEVGAALRTREDESGRFKRLEVRKDCKINALTTVLTDSVVCSPIRVGSCGKDSQSSRIYSVYGKTIAITANGGGMGARGGLYKVDLPDGDYTVRKLTPIETERCQTLADNYTANGIDENEKLIKISNTQRYKCIGNAWTVSVIAHILSHMNFEN